MKNIERIRYFFLIVFIASLSFEYWDPLGISSFFTITKFFGLLYFLFSLFNIKKYFDLRYTKSPVVILLFLWVYLLVISVINLKPSTSLSILNFTFLQNIVLFWLISNDLIRKPNIKRILFLGLILSVISMSILIGFGIGLDIETDQIGTTRLSFFGSNPNGIGNLAAIALFLTLHMLIYRRKYFGKITWLMLLTIPPLLNLISLSGSRGALIIALVGVLSLIILQRGNSIKKVVISVVGLALIYFGIGVILESDVMRNRVLSSLEDGGLGGREIIWNHALEIFADYPFFGIGVSGYEYEMIKRMGVFMDTHNLFLYFMVTGGIIGISLYLLFVYRLLCKSIKYYKYENDALLLGILIIYIFSIVKSGGALNSKLFWILTAFIYGIGSSLKTSNRIKKRSNAYN